MESAMNRFWKLIDKSRIDAADVEEQMDFLLDLLAEREPEEILSFHHCFSEAVRSAYRWDLWGAAHLINGHCTEDGFDYFLGWLIAQGRDYYLAAIEEPQAAGDRAEEHERHECEDIWSVAARAYEARTSRTDFYNFASENLRLTLKGEPWAERDLRRLYPRLALRFG